MFKNLIQLFKYTKGVRHFFVFSILSIAIATVFNLLLPLIIKFTIDSVLDDKKIESTFLQNIFEDIGGRTFLQNNLYIIAVVLILSAVIGAFFTYLHGKFVGIGSESVVRKLRDNLYNHIENIDMKGYRKYRTGDLIQRCSSDMETIKTFLTTQSIEIVRTIFIAAFATIIMASLSLKLMAISLAVVPIIIGVTTLFFIKIQKKFKLVEEAESKLLSNLQENLSAIRVVKAYNREGYEIEKFDKNNKEFQKESFDLMKYMAYFWSSTDILAFTQIALVFFIGIYWVLTKDITLGVLVAFLRYEWTILWPIRNLGRVLADLGKTLISVKRVEEIFKLESEIKEGVKPKEIDKIVVKDLSFGYDDDKNILSNISLNIEMGNIIAITGETGSGKSTFIDIILKFLPYKMGSIKIGDIELKDISTKWLRDNVAVVLQDIFLYSKTVGENIKIGKLNSTDKEMEKVTKLAEIDKDIKNFENGYNTIVGEKGVTLSGGQKQRVAIARALIKNAPILIFDDALSALDTETDRAIRERLRDQNGDNITILISHRVSSMFHADQIIVFENGAIVEKGDNKTLLESKGIYYDLWISQHGELKNG